MKVLVTGGAGFIGTHLSRRLLSAGHEVRILDNFSKQIHGDNQKLHPDISQAELITGDVRDLKKVEQSLEGIDVLVHLAAETGTGQSMYELELYDSVNVGGTRNYIEVLLKNPKKYALKNIVVASSRATYGEGAYNCSEHGLVYPKTRSEEAMLNSQFEPQCPVCQKPVKTVATPESAPFQPLSFYALTKQVQEQMILMYAPVLGTTAYALRYQNVYGPGQSLKNPYTGIMAIFSTLARKNEPIRIFEDGLESRDFVFIDDVIEATVQCIHSDKNEVSSFNVGSGVRTSVIQIAESIKSHFKSSSNIEVTGEFRLGDIRHNFADLSLIKKNLGYKPTVDFDTGLKSFLNWAHEEPIPDLGFEKSLKELSDAGLFKKSIS